LPHLVDAYGAAGDHEPEVREAAASAARHLGGQSSLDRRDDLHRLTERLLAWRVRPLVKHVPWDVPASIYDYRNEVRAATLLASRYGDFAVYVEPPSFSATSPFRLELGPPGLGPSERIPKSRLRTLTTRFPLRQDEQLRATTTYPQHLRELVLPRSSLMSRGQLLLDVSPDSLKPNEYVTVLWASNNARPSPTNPWHVVFRTSAEELTSPRTVTVDVTQCPGCVAFCSYVGSSALTGPVTAPNALYSVDDWIIVG
jgi:hypothetical protein